MSIALQAWCVCLRNSWNLDWSLEYFAAHFSTIADTVSHTVSGSVEYVCSKILQAAVQVPTVGKQAQQVHVTQKLGGCDSFVDLGISHFG